MAFWKFTGSSDEFFPSLGLTARPGEVYDFGDDSPPREPLAKGGQLSPIPASKWVSDPGPATDFNVVQASDVKNIYVARQVVDLYDTDHGLKGDNATDDTAALNNMVAAAYALLDNGTASAVRLHFRARTYLLAGAIQNPDGPGGAYAQVPLRNRALTATRDNIEFVGAARGPFTMNEAQTAVQRAGTVFRSTATGTLDAGGKGVPSVIGGPALAGLNNDTAHSLSNTCARFTNITVELPDDPSIAGVDLWSCEQARLHNFVQTTAAGLNAVTLPTHPHAVGLILPRALNNGASMTGINYLFGAYCAFLLSENTHVSNFTSYQTIIGIGLAYGANPSRIDFACPIWAQHSIAALDVTSGPVDLPTCYVSVGLLSIEDAGDGSKWANVEHVKNGGAAVHLSGEFCRVKSGIGAVSGLTITGSTGTGLRDLTKATTDLTWHDATLGNSWVANGDPYPAPGYRLLPGGEVELRGLMKSGTNGTVAFNLPTGYRPGAQRMFPVVGGGFTFAAVDINSGGDVIVDAGTNTYISLDGIRFLAEL